MSTNLELEPLELDGDPRREARREVRRQNFLNIATRRVRTSLTHLRLIAQCGDRGRYEYTEDEAIQLTEVLYRAVDEIHAAFAEKEPFTFSDGELPYPVAGGNHNATARTDRARDPDDRPDRPG